MLSFIVTSKQNDQSWLQPSGMQILLLELWCQIARSFGQKQILKCYFLSIFLALCSSYTFKFYLVIIFPLISVTSQGADAMFNQQSFICSRVSQMLYDWRESILLGWYILQFHTIFSSQYNMFYMVYMLHSSHKWW